MSIDIIKNKIDNLSQQSDIDLNILITSRRQHFLSLNTPGRLAEIVDIDTLNEYIEENATQLMLMSKGTHSNGTVGDPLIFKYHIVFYINVMKYNLTLLSNLFRDIFDYTETILSNIIVNNNFNTNFIKILQNERFAYNGDEVIIGSDSAIIKRIYKNIEFSTYNRPNNQLSSGIAHSNIKNKYIEYYSNGNVKMVSWIDSRNRLIYQHYYENIRQINNYISINKTTMTGTITVYRPDCTKYLHIVSDLYNQIFTLMVFDNNQERIYLKLNAKLAKSSLTIFN